LAFCADEHPVEQQGVISTKDRVMSRSLRLGDVLVEQGVISEAQLARSLRHQSETGTRLGEALHQLGFVSGRQLSDALEWQSAYGLSALSELLPNPEAAKLLSEKFCRTRQVLAFDFDSDGSLLLAMADPIDILTIDDVRLITDLEVRPVAATKSTLHDAWEIVWRDSGQFEKLECVAPPAAPKVADREAAEYKAVVALVEQAITAALRRRASDIHFEPRADGMAIRLRIDGVLHFLTTVRDDLKYGVVSRIKIMGDMDIAEKRLPQDGRATFRSNDRLVDLRIATVPTVFGENVTIRVLDEGETPITLETLGMDDDQLALFRKALHRSWGEILITGPTGSGKSTTLYAGLEELNTPNVKIYTVEDPVERRISGIMQSQVRPNIGLDFASMLRSLVRSDPDIIMIGEIRDHETALIATESSLTGHLVLSTLHTNDAASTIARLVEMGIPAYLIASCLELIVAQRLARRLCLRCKEQVRVTKSTVTEEERAFLGTTNATVWRAVGCKHCFGTGYSGRIGLFEALPVTRDIRRLILEHATADEIRDQAQTEGVHLLLGDGRQKVLSGLTTIGEVLRVNG
jgi:type IV pilus assembly protein PilB